MSNPFTALLLTSATPADNSGTVAVGADIVLSFSDSVLAGSGTITVSDGATQTYMGRDGLLHTRLVGATDTRTISISDSSQVSISGNVVTLNLAADLKNGVTYSVQMGPGVLYNSAGGTYAGLSDSTKLNFTTSVASEASAPSAYVNGSLHISNDSGSSNTDFITNVASQTISGTYSGTLGSGEYVEVSLDNGETWHTASASANQWSYAASVGFSNILKARVSNASHLHSSALSHSYTYDNAAPQVSAIGLSDDTLGSGQSGAFSVAFNEKVLSVSAASFNVSGGTLGTFTTADDGLTWQSTLTPSGAASGNITLLANSTDDVAGNSGPAANSNSVTFSYTQQVETEPATPVLNSTFSLSADTGTSNSDFITKTATQTISGTFTGTVSGTAKIEVSSNGGTSWSAATVNNTTHTWSYGETTLPNSGTLQVRLTNEQGGTSTVSHSYQIDTTAPASMANRPAPDLTADSDTGHSNIDNITNVNLPTFNFSVVSSIQGQSFNAVAGDRLEIYDLTAGSVAGSYTILASDFDGYGAINFTSKSITLDHALIDGSHELVTRVTDAAGNSGETSRLAALVTIDTQTPTEVSVAPVQDATGIATDTVITLVFDEAIYLSAFHEVRLTNDTTNVSVDIAGETGHLSLSVDGKTLTITPFVDLSASSHYTVTLNVGALADDAGNIVIAKNTVLTEFSTTASGTIVPATPTLSITDSASASGPSTESSDHITRLATVTVSGLTATHWEYTVDGGDHWSDGSGTSFSLANGVTYAQGDVEVRQYTSTDNKSLAGELSHAVTIDQTAPVATFDTSSLPGYFGLSVPIDLEGDLTGTLGDADYVEYSLDYGSTWKRAESDSDEWEVEDVMIAEGGAIGLRITDTAGNVGTNSATAAHTIYIGDGYGGEFSASASTVLYAGYGNDAITLNANTSSGMIDGGGGTDTLNLGQSLTLGNLLGHVKNIETIGLTSNVTLTVGDIGSSALSAMSLPTYFAHSVLKIDGDDSNSIDITSDDFSAVSILNTTLLAGLANALGSLTGYNVWQNEDTGMILLIGSDINLVTY
ncbi:MAG: Ig-like domain-containing protein [Pseudomonadota bacterium]